MLESAAILYHPHRERAIAEAEWLDGELTRHGVAVQRGNGWDPTLVREVALSTQLVISLGGDGTILHIARLLAASAIPLLGINLGRVGFLAEMTPHAVREKIGGIVEETYWIEQRAMLDVELHWEGERERFISLNEVAVARGTSARAVHVQTRLDSDPFMTYTADGVLVATATGSTAYSLAAGGPILYPESREFMLTPVAPHLHIGRSIILPPDIQVTLSVSGDRPGIMSVDGADERTLGPDDVVRVCRSDLTARFARFSPRTYFYEAIAARLR